MSELPDLRSAKILYGDFETSSGDDKKKSTNPWRDCSVAGIGVTVDEIPGAWYVPVNHRHGVNLPQDIVADWWCDCFASVMEWDNANVKYDAHVSTNCLGVMPDCTLGDITTWFKLIDSDRQGRGGYSLDALSKAFLNEDITKHEAALKPYLVRSKDYGRVPSDVMAPYCGQDVISGRRLAQYAKANMPERCAQIFQTETDLTSLLFHVERHGMRVNRQQLQIAELKAWTELTRLDLELTAIVGRTFNPATNADCYDVICNQYGMPVLAWTEEPDDDDGEPAGNPSFDKHALAQYLAHPYSPVAVLERIIAYRKINTFKNFFVTRYQQEAIECNDGTGDSIMHPSYNQCVRTGRMSCKRPNQQQLNKDAKELIICAPGEAIVSLDDSAAEFRTIAHYVQDPDIIAAYNEDPDTDFHQWVADMIEIKRKPAKTINFLMAFGGGKEKLLTALESNMDLVGDIKAQVERMVESGEIEKSQEKDVFSMLARRKAEDTYSRYHETIPNLKRVARSVARVAESRGSVYNLMGRNRHLPAERAHIAFNTLNQSSAADMMKARMVKLWKYLVRAGLFGPGKINIMGQVHDELVFTMPIEMARDDRTMLGLVAFMETPPCELRVPWRCAIGRSERHWREACTDLKDGGPCGVIKYDRADAVASGLNENPMRHLLECV